MKKKLIFCICILLSILMGISSVPYYAYSYDCPVEVESASALVVNLDTDTVVYEKNADTARFISYLSNIMTFIVAYHSVNDIQEEIKITDEMLSDIPNSDGSLNVYKGKTVTVVDLLYMIAMTNGNDACYVLADYVTNGDRDKFIVMMNEKARELGCTKTKFSSVAARNNTSQYSTCSDLYKIVKSALEISGYCVASGTALYVPVGYEGEKYTIQNTNSIIRKTSPYYFVHAQNGKYAADSAAKGNLVAVAEYANVSYVCILLSAQQLSEHNAYTEASKLFSWAYTKLGNKQIVSASDVLATSKACAPWGDIEIELVSGKDIQKTVPANYNSEKFTFEYDEDTEISLPVFKGQNMGTAQVLYDGKPIDEIELISNSSQGVSMLSDVASFVGAMFEETLVSEQTKSEDELVTEETQSASEKIKETQAE